jgi:hypothetical protein
LTFYRNTLGDSLLRLTFSVLLLFSFFYFLQ